MRRRRRRVTDEPFDVFERMQLSVPFGPNGPPPVESLDWIPDLASRWPVHGGEVVRMSRRAGGRWDPAAELPWIALWGWPEGTGPDDPEPDRGPYYGWGRFNGEWVPPGGHADPVADVVDIDAHRRS